MLAAEEDRGEATLEAGVVCRPLASSSACTFLINFEGRVNMPFKGSHWKYRTPATEPSFLPMGSSKTMPAHWPGANWVSPRNWINPGLFPFTQTRSPTRKSSTNSSCASEDGALDVFSLDIVFSTGAATAAGVLKAVLPGLRILVGTFRPLGFSELIVLGVQSGWAFPCCHYLLPTIGTTVDVSIVKSVWGLNRALTGQALH